MRRYYPISPTQCQAARTYLDWTQDALAKAAAVGRSTVYAFEEGGSVRHESVAKIREAFEKHGIQFTEGEGVKRLDPFFTLYRGYGSSDIFFNDVLESSKAQGGDVYCAVESQDLLLKIFGLSDTSDIERLELLGQRTRVRCLVTEAQMLSFDVPSIQFRSGAVRIINATATVGYGNKFVVVMRETTSGFYFAVFNGLLAGQDYRTRFLSAWEDAEPMQTAAKLRERLAKASIRD
jgi:DNA-binding XRE family transcriptional regulator